MTDDLPPCIVLVDEAARTGADNMRRDEALLEQVTAGEHLSYVRIYRWSVPTISLGYFQKLDDAIDPRLASCDRVKRITGGGAILHDQELTYSCAVPSSHPVHSDPIQLYEQVHSAIIGLLSTLGVNSSMRRDAPGWAEETAGEEPFLCFLRSDPRDVVIGSHKVIGSAQRRRRGSILQHGSILLRTSPLTPEVPGICNLSENFDEAAFAELLPETIGRSLSATTAVREITKNAQ